MIFSTIRFMANTYSLIGAVMLLFQFVGQAVTGGVRLTEEPGMMSPFSAASILLWLLCIVYSALNSFSKDASK